MTEVRRRLEAEREGRDFDESEAAAFAAVDAEVGAEPTENATVTPGLAGDETPEVPEGGIEPEGDAPPSEEVSPPEQAENAEAEEEA